MYPYDHSIKNKNYRMKKISFFLFLLILCSCSDDERYSYYSYNDPTIYSSSDKILFSEIILFMKPYISDNGKKKYVIVENLHELSIVINNNLHKTSDSYTLDTLHLNKKETIGNYRVTTDPVTYPVVINIRSRSEDPRTAGEYADILNNYMILPPGAYVCQIQSFYIKDINGELNKIITPTLSLPLIVNENYASSNLGELEVLINN